MKKNKKQRFVSFIDETLKATSKTVYEKLQEKKTTGYPLVLKLVVKDIRYLRFIKITEDSYEVLRKIPEEQKVDCYMIFDRAKTIHYVLSGKVLPLSSSLIGKLKIIYLTREARAFSAIYNPAKNNYLKIIKGTRFTLNKKKKDKDGKDPRDKESEA